MSTGYFAQGGATHRNNFDALRILFAAMVIVTHSELLTGAGESDALFRLTGRQTNFSYLGVRGFFALSGYLVFQSLLRSKGPADYFLKRGLRIFPGLLLMLAMMAFVVGPLFSDGTPGAYFSSDHSMRYALSELRVFPVRRTDVLPGLFTRNPAGPVVNGSLWTIWFEMLFYIGLALLFLLRRNLPLLRGVTAGGWAAMFLGFLFFHQLLDPIIFPFTGMSAEVAADLLLYFAAGSAAAATGILKRPRIPFLMGVAGLTVLVLSLAFGGFFFLRYLSWPMVVLGFGSLVTPPLPQIRRLGEPSYGMYIWAYPVQQILVQELSPRSGMLTLLTLVIVIPLGYASWHLVEKRFLRQK